MSRRDGGRHKPADAPEFVAECGRFKAPLAAACGRACLRHGSRPRRSHVLEACRDCPAGELVIVTVQEGRGLEDGLAMEAHRDHGVSELSRARFDTMLWRRDALGALRRRI